MAAFNVGSLKQAGRQAALALTLAMRYVAYVNIVTELTSPSVSSHFWLCKSGEPETVVMGSVGAMIVESEC